MITKKPYEILFKNIHEFRIENTILLDLLDIFSTIYIHDITTKRNQKTNVSISIPVNNIEIWKKSRDSINKIVNFMTNNVDTWSISFEHELKKKEIKKPLLFYQNEIFKPSKVTLFSGGLDSFAGIANDLRDLPSKVLLAGYKINNHEYHSQNKIFKTYILKVDSSVRSQIFTLGNIKKIEPTQRTRSLLFFALGIVMALIHDKDCLFLYENGIMSLNPEINHSRYTTKTTHPATISMMNKILIDSGINCQIRHPYLFNTKGEMISNIKQEHLPHILKTITCGRNRQDIRFDASKKQCGACVPCLLRKISMSSLDYEKFDTVYDIEYSTKLSDNHKLIDEYKSSVQYFIDYKNAIKDKSIYNILNLRNRNYTDRDWLQKTDRMLNAFTKEVENFVSKYKILD